ncbi:hypothetical protein Dsin_010235 [Dipteronia sinensis]|uniref:Uncharacterized protein n=1 Tax=Dipteronia sinensis TaxID=43782 RepID=A0AAE0EE84_9ROSI|nr:hypothetical protein Dsin_010235 [Dipteronia sinensis]
MRKISTMELLSNHRIDMLKGIRTSEVETSIRGLYKIWKTEGRATNSGIMVDIKEWLGDLTYNIALRLVGGKRYLGASADCEGEVRSCQKVALSTEKPPQSEVTMVSPATGMALAKLVITEKAIKQTAKKMDTLIGSWLEKHKKKRLLSGEKKKEQDSMDDADTINKALACLSHELQVEESDIKNLIYLQAIIKETLRLYPPSPNIALRAAMEDCTLSNGYHIPAATRLMVKAWKIQRDECVWPDPGRFCPERFLTSHKDKCQRSKF